MISFPNKKYQIIYADPPWEYRTWTAKGGHKSASAHYKTMTLNDICHLPVEEIAGEDCILFLWATFPNLKEAFKVISDWGFAYKTVAFTWIKLYANGSPVIGLGYWTRANAEVCLLATRGNIKRKSNSVSQIIMEKRNKHSEKPHIIREKIVELMGDLPWIELFARHKAKGWDAWGNEELQEAYIQDKILND